jgi:hypothetical protein
MIIGKKAASQCPQWVDSGDLQRDRYRPVADIARLPASSAGLSGADWVMKMLAFFAAFPANREKSALLGRAQSLLLYLSTEEVRSGAQGTTTHRGG